MSATADPQTSIYETTIENDDVEKALEERQTLKEKASIANALYREADEKAKAAIAGLDLGNDAPVRLGRFVLKRTIRPSRSVSFETEAKVQLRISTLDEGA